MKIASVPVRDDSEDVSPHLLPIHGMNLTPDKAVAIGRSARNTALDPADYQFICRDMYGVRFFLNERVHRGQGCFLTGRWVDYKKASCTVIHFDGSSFTFGAHFTPAELRADA